MDTNEKLNNELPKPPQKPMWWLTYTALVIAGIVLLSDALGFAYTRKLTFLLGLGLVYSAFSLVVGRQRPSAILSVVIIWAAVVVTMLY